MSTWTTEDRQEAEKTMNNELTEGKSAEQPVAWRYWGFNVMNEPAWVYSDEWNKYYPLMGVEPLYTAPQSHPAKTLTDEKIDFITKRYFNIHPEAKLSEQFRIKLYELEDFARAILRKAQEK